MIDSLFFVLVGAFLAGVAFFAFRRTKEAGGSDVGHDPATPSHGRGGSAANGKSTTDSAELARLKFELLEAWAKRGEPIDHVTEAKAQLAATEVVERGRRWRELELAADEEDTLP